MNTHKSTPTVLIADSSHIVLTLARAALEKAGYLVLTHQNPTGCLTRIILERPDLVLIDVSMPALSGETIVKLLGSAKPKSNAIVLLHSSMHEAELADRARASGADGYIKKSSNQAHLVKAVDKWLGRLRQYDSATLPVAQRLTPVADPVDISSPAPVTLTEIAEASEQPLKQVSSPDSPAVSGVRRLAPTVLFVDDEMLALSAYRRTFQADEFQMEFSLSGEQAMKRIQSATPPDVVVCDVMMPNTDGRELFAKAAAVDSSWRHRIVFVTGAVGAGRLRLTLDHFTGEVLEKPFKADDLRRAIQACIQSARLLPVKASSGVGV